MIKAILFDFGQTLVDSADGFRLAEKEAQKKIYLDLQMTDWNKFISIYRKVRTEFYTNSIMSRVTIWTEVYRRFSVQVNSRKLETWEHDYWEIAKSKTTPFSETEQVLEKLHLKYRLAIITNTQGQKTTEKHRISLFPKIEKFFMDIIVAGESGIPPKPDSISFLKCLKNLGVSPYDAVFVGDDWEKDISGARNAGIQPIWIQHHSVQRNWPNKKTLVPIITSLDQLLHFKFA
jgi:HAD superfamily hydrolase (TIGR01549 family)